MAGWHGEQVATLQRRAPAKLSDNLLRRSPLETPERRRVFNIMPTSFVLSDEQVDALIAVGSELLLGNAEFRRFRADVGR